VLFALAVTFAGCQRSDGTGPSEASTDALRVLFIGNSLTYWNDLPELVRALADASNTRTISTDMVAQANFALVDHFTMSDALTVVREGRFDIVVLQQGPSSLAVNRDSLRLWTAEWAAEIRAAGGWPALYAVWPNALNFSSFPAVSESYRLAAADVHGLFFPVGDTWLATWEQREDAPLYDADQFHPGLAGSYAAAVVMVSVLTGRSPTSLATEFRMPSGLEVRFDDGIAEAIQTAAAEVLSRVGAQPVR
jgi:hypothetical protein